MLMEFFDIIGLAVFRIEKHHGKCQCLISLIQLDRASSWIDIVIEDVDTGIFLKVNMPFLDEEILC